MVQELRAKALKVLPALSLTEIILRQMVKKDNVQIDLY